LAADCVLLCELAMGLALIAGAVLARRRHYRAHAGCQSAVMLLNLLIVIGYMVPAFRRAVAPGLVAHIGRSYYWLAAAHEVLGISAELLGLYIILVAGTKILPPRFRFARYQLWMRSALALWWLVLLLGLATYIRWYGVPLLYGRNQSSGRFHAHLDGLDTHASAVGRADCHTVIKQERQALGPHSCGGSNPLSRDAG
jgi:uncharacterized membrane protein YozB (DUF420 family)